MYWSILFGLALAWAVEAELSDFSNTDHVALLQTRASAIASAAVEPDLKKAYHVTTTIDSFLEKYELDEKTINATRTCWEQFQAIPRETQKLLDEPGMACFEGFQMTNNLGGQFLEVNVTNPTFPSTHVDVPEDNAERMHVFVVGPESSGTTFTAKFAAAALGLDPTLSNPIDRVSDNSGALWHISFPEGNTCGGASVEPILDDAGVDQDLLPRYSRFYVDIASVVAQYKARGEKVAFVQVARNPSVSLQAKMNHGHCLDPSISQVEQTQAFDLMVAAMDVPEVATVCYEELIAGGSDYLIKKLSTVGITPKDTLPLPGVSAGSATSSGSCSPDMAAYAKLCPNSPAAKEC